MFASIKNLLACLTLVMAVASSPAAITNSVTFNFEDILQRAYVDRSVTVESVSTPRTNSPNIAVNYYLSTNTGTSGSFVLYNMLDGTYRVSVLGNPRPTTFLINVPTDNPATLYASDLLTTNIDANATTAWTRSQADSRYVRANTTNGVLISPTNFFWANITNGANVAIARGAGGKLTISATNSGGGTTDGASLTNFPGAPANATEAAIRGVTNTVYIVNAPTWPSSGLGTEAAPFNATNSSALLSILGANVAGGKKYKFAAGTYDIETNFSLSSATSIEGVPGATRLRFTTDWVGNNQTMFTSLEGNSNILFSGIIFDGNSQNHTNADSTTHAIHVYHGGVTVVDCDFTGFRGGNGSGESFPLFMSYATQDTIFRSRPNYVARCRFYGMITNSVNAANMNILLMQRPGIVENCIFAGSTSSTFVNVVGAYGGGALWRNNIFENVAVFADDDGNSSGDDTIFTTFAGNVFNHTSTNSTGAFILNTVQSQQFTNFCIDGNYIRIPTNVSLFSDIATGGFDRFKITGNMLVPSGVDSSVFAVERKPWAYLINSTNGFIANNYIHPSWAAPTISGAGNITWNNTYSDGTDATTNGVLGALTASRIEYTPLTNTPSITMTGSGAEWPISFRTGNSAATLDSRTGLRPALILGSAAANDIALRTEFIFATNSSAGIMIQRPANTNQLEVKLGDNSTFGDLWVANLYTNGVQVTGGSGGSQTPWTSDIDAAEYRLLSLDYIRFTADTPKYLWWLTNDADSGAYLPSTGANSGFWLSSDGYSNIVLQGGVVDLRRVQSMTLLNGTQYTTNGNLLATDGSGNVYSAGTISNITIQLAGMSSNQVVVTGQDGQFTNLVLNADQFVTNVGTASGSPSLVIKSGAALTNTFTALANITNLAASTNALIVDVAPGSTNILIKVGGTNRFYIGMSGTTYGMFPANDNLANLGLNTSANRWASGYFADTVYAGSVVQIGTVQVRNNAAYAYPTDNSLNGTGFELRYTGGSPPSPAHGSTNRARIISTNIGGITYPVMVDGNTNVTTFASFTNQNGVRALVIYTNSGAATAARNYALLATNLAIVTNTMAINTPYTAPLDRDGIMYVTATVTGDDAGASGSARLIVDGTEVARTENANGFSITSTVSAHVPRGATYYATNTSDAGGSLTLQYGRAIFKP